MSEDPRLFEIANALATYHTKRGWFESEASALARLIRLRSDIYRTLFVEARAALNRSGDE